MRKGFFILSVIALLAACTNDAEPTAPVSSGRASTALAYPPGPSVSGKARPGEVTTVEGGVYEINWWNQEQQKSGFATCPAGTVVVGGGYRILAGYGNAHVITTAPQGTTYWKVEIAISNSDLVKFSVVAQCQQQ